MRRWVIEYGWFVMMGAVVLALGCIWYEVHQANRHAAKNTVILSTRDFDRIHREHAEMKTLLCALHPELKEQCGR